MGLKTMAPKMECVDQRLMAMASWTRQMTLRTRVLAQRLG
jgi:hypothetical protein